MTLDVFEAKSANSKRWRSRRIEWSEVVDWAREPSPTKESTGYVLGRFKGAVRRGTDLIDRCALTLDVDRNGGGMVDKVRALGVKLLIHSTYSSAPDEPRWRIIIPLNEPISGAEYELAAVGLAQHLGIESFDRTSFRPTQFMWRPGAANAEWYQWYAVDGPVAHADDFIMMYDPEDHQSSSRPGRIQKQDQLHLSGVVGAFNRVYAGDLDLLIETYALPYVRDGEDRYRYAEASSVAGMGPVAGRPDLYFSHHATDPAGGQPCSSFDLVRLHEYADLDIGAKPGTPVHRLPSHAAMAERATEDELVRAELVRTRHDSSDLREQFGEDVDPGLADVGSDTGSSWEVKLTADKNGSIEDRVQNWEIILEQDPAFRVIQFDEVLKRIEVVGRFPWDETDRESDGIDEADYIALTMYLERRHGLRISKDKAADYVLMVASRNRVNHIKDYLCGLEWDGVARVETCLPGVVDDAYTRLAARKALVGAVARALDPGCQMDHSLILFGSEGVGKSRWIRNMAVHPEWTAELGQIGAKDTLMTMSTKWLVVSDEVDSMRAAQFDALKSFLTLTKDNYRAPYAREVQEHPRRCAIWGTTNDPKFLKPQAGNRRFLIVHCRALTDEGDIDDRSADPGWVDQVWAEAVALYRAGEPVHMTPSEMRLANDARMEFTARDPLVGRIKRYLRTPVPLDWELMSPNKRAEFLLIGFDLDEWTTPQTLSVLSVAQEVMGIERGIPNDRELSRIRGCLDRLDGWMSVGTMDTAYGPQETYVPVDSLI